MFLERKFHNFFKNKERSILTKKKKEAANHNSLLATIHGDIGEASQFIWGGQA